MGARFIRGHNGRIFVVVVLLLVPPGSSAFF
jgi:hypothetical protein